MVVLDRRQAVEDKMKGRIIYKGLWTDEEDQMLRQLVARMADLPRCVRATTSNHLARHAEVTSRLTLLALRTATKSGSPSARP